MGDLLPDLDAAGEGDDLDRLVGEHLVEDRRAVAGDDCERVGGIAGLEHGPGEPERRQRRLLGRLEHDRRAGGDRRRELVRHLVERMVERRDRRHEPDRLTRGECAARPAVRRHVAGVELAVVAERLARREAEDVGCARDLVAGVARGRGPTPM